MHGVCWRFGELVGEERHVNQGQACLLGEAWILRSICTGRIPAADPLGVACPHFRQFLNLREVLIGRERTRHLKGDKHTTISMLKGGKRICKAFNDGRGCKGGCGAEHVCDVKLPNGKSSHNRLQHEATE